MNARILESMLVSLNDGYRDWKFVRTLGWASTYEGRIELTKGLKKKSLHVKKGTFLKGCEVGMSLQATTTPRWTSYIARCGLKSNNTSNNLFTI
jgi:hypothetical protein